MPPSGRRWLDAAQIFLATGRRPNTDDLGLDSVRVELGRAGLTGKQARDEGREVEVATFELSDNGKAKQIGETAGLVKVVVETDSRRILGAAVLAAHGSELVHGFLDVMAAGAPYTAILETVRIHPTLSEALHSAVDSFEA